MIVIRVAFHALVLVVSQPAQLVLLIGYLLLTVLALLMLLLVKIVDNFAHHVLKTVKTLTLAISVPLVL